MEWSVSSKWTVGTILTYRLFDNMKQQCMVMRREVRVRVRRKMNHSWELLIMVSTDC